MNPVNTRIGFECYFVCSVWRTDSNFVDYFIYDRLTLLNTQATQIPPSNGTQSLNNSLTLTYKPTTHRQTLRFTLSHTSVYRNSASIRWFAYMHRYIQVFGCLPIMPISYHSVYTITQKKMLMCQYESFNRVSCHIVNDRCQTLSYLSGCFSFP